MEYGIGLIAVIAITGGMIAFIGDKLGTRVGKRRMSLFGLRPKYTSILVTIVTGILIAASTIAIMAILSSNVRTALFGLEKLRQDTAALTLEIDAKNKEIEQSQDKVKASQQEIETSRKELDTKVRELDALNLEVDRANNEMLGAVAAKEVIAGELITAQQAYGEAQEHLKVSQKDVADLEATKTKLDSHITNLEITTKQLEKNIAQLREGNLLFRVGEVLAGAVVRPGLTNPEIEMALADALNNTNTLILKRINSTTNQNMIYVTQDNVKAVTEQIAASKVPMYVRIITDANVIYGEPAVTHLVAQPYVLVYAKGTPVWTATVMGGKNSQEAILTFLRDVNYEATNRGILPNPLTGQVGSLTGSDLYETIDKLTAQARPVQLVAYTTNDIYTSGPLHIRLEIKNIDQNNE